MRAEMSADTNPERASAAASVRVRDLGRVPYAAALDLQRQLNQAVIDGVEPPVLLLVEHDPVVTLSHRKSAGSHLLASPERLAAMGIDRQETDRGGDITYHGPGQLVAYPILRLSPLGLNLGRYMRALEDVVIQVLAAFGVEGFREEGATGVWVEENGVAAKVCAMGVRVRKNTTMHGLALNVTTDLSHFGTIVPCGLAGRPVTSLQRLLGPDTPPMARVKRAIITAFADVLNLRMAEETA